MQAKFVAGPNLCTLLACTGVFLPGRALLEMALYSYYAAMVPRQGSRLSKCVSRLGTDRLHWCAVAAKRRPLGSSGPHPTRLPAPEALGELASRRAGEAKVRAPTVPTYCNAKVVGAHAAHVLCTMVAQTPLGTHPPVVAGRADVVYTCRYGYMLRRRGYGTGAVRSTPRFWTPTRSTPLAHK